jgi:hypothetical protein
MIEGVVYLLHANNEGDAEFGNMYSKNHIAPVRGEFL